MAEAQEVGHRFEEVEEAEAVAGVEAMGGNIKFTNICVCARHGVCVCVSRF